MKALPGAACAITEESNEDVEGSTARVWEGRGGPKELFDVEHVNPSSYAYPLLPEPREDR